MTTKERIIEADPLRRIAVSRQFRTSNQIRRSVNIRTGRSVARSTSTIDTGLEATDIAIADVFMKAERAKQSIKDKGRRTP